MDQYILVDFDDSFTWNIVSTLAGVGIEVEVIPYKKFVEFFKSKIATSDQKYFIIYGPGPGHPREYCDLGPVISELLNSEQHFQMGICLGHQILMSVMGLDVEIDPRPLHGHSVSFNIPKWPEFFSEKYIGQDIQVQRYNSLYVKSGSKAFVNKLGIEQVIDQGQVVAAKFKRGISYQFHPESIGTSCPNVFFNTSITRSVE
ncbi:MAG: aminodeoxychorismate/anthranilate synthase component II [Bacteriovoracaceae bacterium]|jgi:anthranilate/para-aminobenzoate synthase component II|nr:aminodeoxychorismate/anthranilate synthase component II [Bacteriovoracaceae bacterium]